MEELAQEMADGEQGSVLWSGWLERAGQVQLASGQRAIENKVLADEQLGEDDPRYWLGRCFVAADDEARPRCAFLIVRAGLESGDWRAAREAWPIGRQDLGPDERRERLARMARIAAEDGEPDAALRLWQRSANYDRSDTAGVRARFSGALAQR